MQPVVDLQAQTKDKMNSPKTALSTNNGQSRPSTPHPHRHVGMIVDLDAVREGGSTPTRHPDRAFNFAYVESDHRANAPQGSGGCIGISMATVINAFRGGPLSSVSHPASPTFVHEENDNSYNPFVRLRQAVQKSLGYAACKIRHNDDCHVSFEVDPFEREKSLMQRLASYGTQETVDSIPNNERNAAGTTSSKNVQFHYPPITSVKLRPRTRSEDINELFFSPEEIDEIEDDRSDTRASDDVETLAIVTEDWNAVPTCTSSDVTDDDDEDSRSGMLLPGAGPLETRRSRVCAAERKIVKGVQIMLREKSTCYDVDDDDEDEISCSNSLQDHVPAKK